MVIYKMTGSGNDFVFLDGRMVPPDGWSPESVRELCRRGTGVGADGLVVLEPGSTEGAVRFRYFNSDGSPAPICGNGALCATRMAAWLELAPGDGMVLETDAGVLEARCLPGDLERAEISLPEPSQVERPAIDLAEGESSVSFTRVGVPHVVVIVRDLGAVPLLDRGRELRAHPTLGTEGANVNFIAHSAHDGWAMRSYERGVECETLACATGALAAAAVLCLEKSISLPWDVRTGSGATLTVSADLSRDGRLRRPRLAGEARLVFRAILS